MGKVMRHTLGASLNIRQNLSSSKGPKPLQLKLLTTYIPKTSAFTLAFSTSQRLRSARASASFFFQAEDGIRDLTVTGVQTCALPIWGSEKDDRRRDLVGRRHAPRRDDARVKALLRVAQRRHHVGLDESWRDGVDGEDRKSVV